jgi:hypothetical protein
MPLKGFAPDLAAYVRTRGYLHLRCQQVFRTHGLDHQHRVI